MDRKPTVDTLRNKIRQLETNYAGLLKRHNQELEKIALAESCREWQATFDATNAAIWILDKGFYIVRANKTAGEMFQLSESEMIGKHCWEIVHGTSDPIPECPIHRLRKSLRRESMEMQLNSHWYEVTVDPILNDGEGYTEVVHIINDITERKLDMIKLIEKDQLFEQSQRLANVGSYSLDLTNRQVLWSKQAYKIFGYAPGEIHPDFDLVTSHIHQDDKARFIKENETFFSGKSDYDAIYRIITKDGLERTVHSKASLTMDKTGHPVRSYGALQDITEQRETEAQLRQARKMEAIGTLAGGIAHDFNNILSMITGNVELALDNTPDTNPTHEQLQDIKTASLRMAGIVKQLLNFSRKSEQNLKPIDLINTINETLAFIRSSLPANIEIGKHFPSEKIVIRADIGQIDQLVMNICINAYQAMEKTGGRIDIHAKTGLLSEAVTSTHTGITPGRYATITISDSGAGIKPVHLHRIFDPYFTTKPFGKGTGMGLAVAHGIVKNHGGIISAKSRPGAGAVFTIHLPVSDQELPQIGSSEKILCGSGSILFIDDEPTIAKIGQMTLERLGYQVVSQTSPRVAWNLFEANPKAFDLVITDMSMPRITGGQLAKRMKALCPDIPIIICTGHSTLMDKDKSIDLGIDGFIMKPYTKKDLALTIRKVLDRV